jgi:hypothetical protein
MSLNNPSVEVARINDPRMEINRRRFYTALKGCSVSTHQSFPATNISSSSVQITCNPPNRGIVIARKVFKEGVYDITITGTNTGVSNILSDGYYALRAFPITSTTASEQITINNSTITQAPIFEYWPELLRYHNEHKSEFGQFSLTPSMQDQSQRYEDLAGSNRNPLGVYGDNAYSQTRGSYPGLEIISHTPTQCVLRATVVEPILLSPLVSGAKSDYTSGLAGVQNMSYSCTFSNLERLMSVIQDQGAPGVKNITNVQVVPTGFKLLFNFLTPSPLNPVPRNLVSSLFSLTSYPTRHNTSIPPGGLVTLNMNSVQVTTIPRRMYLFARRANADRTAFTSDAHFALPIEGNPLTVTWNNHQFCSQMTTPDLYNMSAKNGINVSYNQFVDSLGSIVCLDFATDIGLGADEAPGILGNYQLGLSCQFKNTNTVDTITPTLFVVCVYEGVFTIQDGNSSQQLGVLSRQDVLNSRIVRKIDYQGAQDVFGGNFWDTLKSAVGSVGRYAKKHKLLSKGLALVPDQRAQMASRVAQRLGYGMTGGSLTNEDIKNRITCASDIAEDEDEEDTY